MLEEINLSPLETIELVVSALKSASDRLAEGAILAKRGKKSDKELLSFVSKTYTDLCLMSINLIKASDEIEIRGGKC